MAKMTSFLLFSLLILAGTSCSSQSKPKSNPDKITEVTVDDYEAHVFVSSSGDTIAYRLFIPREYDPEIKYPLVLFHHGGGGSGNDNRRQFEGPCPAEWAGPERQEANPPL